ncbi:unnamed protein product [Calicophoron daubneyi]|uniref:ZW10 C-terminal helical domain-containing protein n=1 Tax=Calicophoron daubneyi TaxID=300641 RepID=A0AAV2T231_CALDB
MPSASPLPSKEEGSTAFRLKVLDAKSKLCEVLQSHHDFQPRDSEILELAKEFEALKAESEAVRSSARLKIVPELTNFRSVTREGDDNRSLSASSFHTEMLAQLEEALDMHENCAYLLRLHRALVRLERTVSQLCICTKLTGPLEFTASMEDDFYWDEEGDDHGEAARTTSNESLGSENLDIDEDFYRICTDDVVAALEESEMLFTQNTKFNKDNVVVFQGFRRTLMRCRRRLAEYVNHFWRQWIVLKSASQPYSFLTPTGDPKEDPQWIFNVTQPTLSEVTKGIQEMCKPTGMGTYSSTDDGLPVLSDLKRPSVLASLTVYAKPELLTQLFRVVAALKESKSRFDELSRQIWKLLFKPWLETAHCTSGSEDERDWPVFRSQLFSDGGKVDEDRNASQAEERKQNGEEPSLLPAWRLELVAPAAVSDSEDTLIEDSCRQLASALQKLYTYLYGLPVSRNPKSSGNESTKKSSDTDDRRVIDFTVKASTGRADYFDDLLAAGMIDGRFAHGLPSVRKCSTAEFLAPVTQAVYRLVSEGTTTGFLIDRMGDTKSSSVGDQPLITGGAQMILRWLHRLSTLNQTRRTDEILGQVRELFADKELFITTQPAGDSECYKPATCTGELQLNENDYLLDDAEMDQICDQTNSPESQGSDQPEVGADYFIPSLTRLLSSKANDADLARFLDLGHFHFPTCKISKTIPKFLEIITKIIAEANSCIDSQSERLQKISDQTVTGCGEHFDADAVRSGMLAMAESLIELVPRLFLLFTSLIPVMHACSIENDLHFSTLYCNDCMFLAHECLTLGELQLLPLATKVSNLRPPPETEGTSTKQPITTEALLERSSSMSTCILVPHLRNVGTNCLLTHLRRIRDSLLECLRKTRGFRDAGLAENRVCCSNSVHQCCSLLRSTSEGLSPLPAVVYSRCMGVLCNQVCSEIVSNVLGLIDLTQADTEVLLDLFQEIDTTITSLFEVDDGAKLSLAELISRRVPQLLRLKGIKEVLGASTMAVIEKSLWNGGNGPLALDAHLTAAELRNLIKAVYSQSAARDQLLRSIH